MAKKSGLFTLLTGAVAGATAVFFSNEKNRQKVKKELIKVTAKAKNLKEKFDKNPDTTVDEAMTNIETVVKKQAKKIKDQAIKFINTKTAKPAPKKRLKKT